MILNVCGYDVEIRYIPGSKQVWADTLSGASVRNDDSGADEELKAINLVLSVSEERMKNSRKKQR